MRTTSWGICALAIMIAIPAATAGRSKKTLDDCTAFDQEDKDDETVSFTIHNTCTVPVDCKVSWRVVCAPDSKKRRSTHAKSAKLALHEAGAGSAEASATVCGDDGWAIDSVNWSCEPNKD